MAAEMSMLTTCASFLCQDFFLIPSKTQRSCVLEEIRYEKDWRHYLCHGFHFFVLHHTFCTSDNTNTQHTVVRFVQRSGGSGQQNIPFFVPLFCLSRSSNIHRQKDVEYAYFDQNLIFCAYALRSHAVSGVDEITISCRWSGGRGGQGAAPRPQKQSLFAEAAVASAAEFRDIYPRFRTVPCPSEMDRF